MEPDVASREAAWMVPLLAFVVTLLGGAAVGLIMWVVNRAIAIALQFRADVLARLDKQDNEQAAQRDEQVAQRGILSEIKDLLRDEINRLRQQLSSHGHRISRLEEKNGIYQRRYDDQDTGD